MLPRFVQVTSEYALGTLWEGWENSQGQGGSSMNHAFMGGGIGEWFYEFALGLRYRHRRARGDGVISSSRCAIPASLSRALVVHTLRLTTREVCALADVMSLSESTNEVTGINDLRRAARAALRSKPAVANPAALLPEAALVLDASIVPALGSARGYLETVYGRLSAEWRWTPSPMSGGCPSLAASISSPGVVGASVLIHAGLFDSFTGPACPGPCLTVQPVDPAPESPALSIRLPDLPSRQQQGGRGSAALPRVDGWVSGDEVYELDAAASSGPWLRILLPSLGSSVVWKIRVGA